MQKSTIRWWIPRSQPSISGVACLTSGLSTVIIVVRWPTVLRIWARRGLRHGPGRTRHNRHVRSKVPSREHNSHYHTILRGVEGPPGHTMLPGVENRLHDVTGLPLPLDPEPPWSARG